MREHAQSTQLLNYIYENGTFNNEITDDITIEIILHRVPKPFYIPHFR